MKFQQGAGNFHIFSACWFIFLMLRDLQHQKCKNTWGINCMGWPLRLWLVSIVKYYFKEVSKYEKMLMRYKRKKSAFRTCIVCSQFCFKKEREKSHQQTVETGRKYTKSSRVVISKWMISLFFSITQIFYNEYVLRF